ncbi:DUF4402 domain-containing protein [Halanaerobium sp. ST460_2HS_T2]|uniref:DUF4402 domain-containing protein n=1 Tax=Halanaerobium sp. ST460_2HS_T2 TaxID=2183914 RepID=UPI000DF1FF70|nr:DUF4402 domain-containing protein [Halanaerobium sp. ST460_2HS_T2]RCW60854.1 uncharacterized protein DUF4402 [Halanaerobium sp. ST460_2HS_T2]
MKNAGKIILIVVVAILFFGSSVQAQLDASEDVNVYAEILDTITIDPGDMGVQDMDFSFGTSPTGGNARIILGTDGSLTVDADSGANIFWNDTGTPAVVQVGGTPDRAYVVSIEDFEVTPSQSTSSGDVSIALADSVSGDSLTVDQFLVEGTNIVDSAFSLDGDGFDELTIGAVLTVTDGISVGNYTGQFILTVAYE